MENTSEQTLEHKKAGTSSEKFWKFTTILLIVVLAVLAFRNPSAPAVVGNLPSAPSVPSAPVDAKTLIDDDTVLGDANAPVTIVEFSDYECPFCARFYQQTLGQIKDNYIKTGKVKLVYRDFPLGFHTNAQKAAEAAECAGEQGKYFEMHDKLFTEGVVGGAVTYKGYAKTLGLDSVKFDKCLDTDAMASEVQKDFTDGQQAGVEGTPAFFINGKMLSGAQPFANFKAVIDAELAK